ncbi:MAG: substrate-binding domain-containing protein [Streptomyces sp.]|uniref:sugar ABC transporter substrate-binding protein n=1 Tax=Streptomyces sp. TaxID=1931 RepID=UPI0025F26DD2|nr:substrate-binding domain-containing protein [Streptomyces sp.]MBW8799410.1 substrate-binding domain-containing protein [Streptomyces sp.]
MTGRRRRVASRARYAVGVLVAGLLTVASAACTGEGTATTDSFTVGLLLPSRVVPRWENSDKPMIEQRVKQLCPHCEVVYANADDDSTTQRQQMIAMITKGVRVLVLGATDNRALRSTVQEAHNAGVPVVAYDRLADGPVSGYVSFDGVEVGTLQGQTLLKAMPAPAEDRTIVMLSGDPTSANAPLYKRGALSVLRGKVRIGRSYDIPGWSTDNANASMTAAISALGPGRIDGVLAANDAIAAGAISALKSAHVRRLPPVTGQDADFEAVQRIVSGDQTMTVYKSFRAEAEAAGAMAVALGRGEQLHTIATTTTDSPTTRRIPSVLLTPVAVTTANIQQTLVKDGMYTIAQICTPPLRSACEKAGLIP